MASHSPLPALFLLAGLAWGCASARATEPAPHPHLAQWMERNSDPRYPAEHFLVGIGVGPDTSAAADDGRVAILASFRTHIASTVTRLEQELVRTEDGRTDWTGTAFTTDALVAQVEGTLEGAQVADAATDPGSGDAWALVVVRRDTLSATLRRRIAEQDVALTRIARETRDLLDAHRVFRARVLLRDVPARLTQLEAWRTELSLVDVGGSAPGASVTLADWIALRQACAAALSFAVQATATVSDEAGREQRAGRPDERIVAEAVKGALRESDAGLGVVDAPGLDAIDLSDFDSLSRDLQRESAGGANFVVRARVDAIHSSRFGSLHVYRGRYSAEILDLLSGEVLVAEIAGEVKGSRPHESADVAATNTLREASAALAGDIAASLR